MADGNKEARHYEDLGIHCGEMIGKVRAPVLNILDCIWVSQASLAGYPAGTTTRLNQILASVDPVAMDYWATKHILYPIDKNEEHHPEKFKVLRRHLMQARDVINTQGGINGRVVTLDENQINVINSSLN
jgi:hypothetical protein